MPINVVRFQLDERPRWGVLRDGQVTLLELRAESTGEFVRAANLEMLATVQGPTLNLHDVRLLSPVTRTQQFLCQGANYRQHMIESGLDPDHKNYNMIFTKAASCIVPADHDVILPPSVALLDYEVELGLVLKRDILAPTVVTSKSLHEWIAGLVIVNDYSARDISFRSRSSTRARAFEALAL